jgi:hypothetical protein
MERIKADDDHFECHHIITKGKNRGKMCYQVNKYCHNINHPRTTNTISKIVDDLPDDDDLVCKYCLKQFKQKNNMYRHKKNFCKQRLNNNNNTGSTSLPSIYDNDIIDYTKVSKEQNTFQHENVIIEEPASTTNIGTVNNYNYNNFIQVVCIGPKDDYFQILSDRMGPDKAREYILNCAKNNLEGDINLIKTVYFAGKKPAEYPIKFLDRARNKVEFVNENQEKIIDPIGAELAKRLCSNLQNGYLVQVNIILECNLKQNKDGKFLDEFDLYNCQNHIYELSNNKYRAKLLKALPY